MESLTDTTGMFQHKKYSIVNRELGYTADDNARALIAALLYHQNFGDERSLLLADTYLAFLLYMQRKDGRFHNVLGFDHRFKDEVGSEDSMGRALWATGYAATHGIQEDRKRAAKEIFDRGLEHVHRFTSPRAKAFAILGLYHYHKGQPEDWNVVENIRILANFLVERYMAEASEGWHWFEASMTYANPRLPQALFLAHEVTGKGEYLRIARDSMDFLTEIQIMDDLFVPIGTRGWFTRGGTRAIYDQQPIEASCMAEAALDGFVSTGMNGYREAALRAFEWYHGKNTKGVPLLEDEFCSCYDGITTEGLNLNQGAESTVSYYICHLRLKKSNII